MTWDYGSLSSISVCYFIELILLSLFIYIFIWSDDFDTIFRVIVLELTNGCFNNFLVFHLSEGFLSRHFERKSFAPFESSSGTGGPPDSFEISYNAYIGFWNFPHGGLPVTISITKQPTLQISAFLRRYC
jgi:hypothetical protein